MGNLYAGSGFYFWVCSSSFGLFNFRVFFYCMFSSSSLMMVIWYFLTIFITLHTQPDRNDELARIEAAGGRVIFVNGARVEGILAMSRAIGNNYCSYEWLSYNFICFFEVA